MLRMDMLLNPGSPVRSPIDQEQVLLPPASHSVLIEQFRGSLISLAPEPKSNEHEEHGEVVEPSTKRLKRGLPGVRHLLESIDNHRDDFTSIISGHAFWGQVPSLNPSVLPSDVVHYTPTDTTITKPKPSRLLFETELHSVLSGPTASVPSSHHQLKNEHETDTLLLPRRPDESNEVEPTEVGESRNGEGTKKKKITICKEDGCVSQALSKQLCMKHGGGPRCSVDGCNNGAKLKNLCFQHGGSTICLAQGCSSKSKRFGYCWSHGGGRICGEEGCNKVSAQGGNCWAHGGGNRCKLPGCTKRSYKQHDYYCKRHAEQCADY